MADEITLTLPRDRPFFRIAHLVLGGLAVRLDVTFEHLEDLQLALAGVLDRPEGEGEVTVRLRVDGDRLTTCVGPFDGERLRGALDRPVGDEGLTLRRLLDAVVDEVELADGEGGGCWIELTKTVRTVSAE